MSLRFVKEAEEEYKSTVGCIRDHLYDGYDDLKGLQEYRLALKKVILRLNPDSIVVKEAPQ